jgi:methionyl-tRNA formyltransferase
MNKKINIALFAETRNCSDEILKKIKLLKFKINITLVVSDVKFKIKLNKVYKKKYLWLKNTKDYEKKLLKILNIKNKIYAFSIQHKWKIPKEIIDRFEYFFNFHFGDIPKYRGHSPIIFAMLNREKFIKGTIHAIDEDLDKGYLVKKISIRNAFLTSYQIERLMSIKFSEYFIKLIEKIYKKKRIQLKKIYGKGKFYSQKNIKKFKEIYSYNDLKTKILAFDYPPHEPSFIKINNKKLYLKGKNSY